MGLSNNGLVLFGSVLVVINVLAYNSMNSKLRDVQNAQAELTKLVLSLDAQQIAFSDITENIVSSLGIQQTNFEKSTSRYVELMSEIEHLKMALVPPVGIADTGKPRPEAQAVSRDQREMHRISGERHYANPHDGLDGLGIEDILLSSAKTTLENTLNSIPELVKMNTSNPCWSRGKPATTTAHSICLPKFVIPCCMKSGTTAMSNYLSWHPNIQMASEKEVSFWSNPDTWPDKVRAYIDLWPSLPDGSETVFFEATPMYFGPGASTHMRMHAAMPDIKLIVMVREPAARAKSQVELGISLYKDTTRCDGSIFETWAADEALSHYMDMVERCYTPGKDFSKSRDMNDFKKCLQKQVDVPQDDWCSRVGGPTNSILNGLYEYMLHGAMDTFGDNLILIVNEELSASPQPIIKKIISFLDLPPHEYTDDQLKPICPTDAHVSPPTSKDALLSNVKYCNSSRYGEMDQLLNSRMKSFYTAHNELFYKTIGRRLPW